MPYCIHCGKEVEEDQEICLHCGCYAKQKNNGKEERVEENIYDKYAYQGSIFVAVGLLIPILLIVGFIYSIKGLRSNRYKKDAIISIVLSVFIMLLYLFALMSLAIFLP